MMSFILQCLIHWDESHVLKNSVRQESSSTVRKCINNERARTGHLRQQCGTCQTAVRVQCFCHGIERAGIMCVLFPTGSAAGETTFSLGVEQKWLVKNWEGQTFCKFSVFYLHTVEIQEGIKSTHQGEEASSYQGFPGPFILKATNFTEYTPTGLVFQHPSEEFYQWNAKATLESAPRTT